MPYSGLSSARKMRPTTSGVTVTGMSSSPRAIAVEAVVAPQEQRDAEAEDEFDRHRAEGEDEGVDQRARAPSGPPQVEIVVEADEMARAGRIRL